MKYKTEYIKVLNLGDLKDWDFCKYCKGYLDYVKGDCKCHKCRINYIFQPVKGHFDPIRY